MKFYQGDVGEKFDKHDLSTLEWLTKETGSLHFHCISWEKKHVPIYSRIMVESDGS